MSSLSKGVLARVINYAASNIVWYGLDETFFSRSCTHMVQICTQPAAATKASQSAIEYFHFIKRLTQEIVAAGQSMTCDG